MPAKDKVKPTLKLGKRAPVSTPRLKFGRYINPFAPLPTPPAEFGHEQLVSDWQMLGNDTVGDCAVAGPLHAEMLWNAEAKTSISVDTDCAIADYSTITGYDSANPDSDQGCDVHQVAKHWRETGLIDASGKAHKIAAFLALTPGNLTELWLATYLFGCVGIGISLPGQWMDDFNAGKAWDTLDDPDIEGGHYVLGVCRRGGNLGVVTWGKVQTMTPAAYREFNDETFVYLSGEMLTDGRSIDGFDLDALRVDLAAL